MPIKNFSPYKVVKEAMKELKPNETKVIAGRFGIESKNLTLSAIGKNLRLSRERIRQIEKEAIKKLAKKIINEENGYVSEIIASFERGGGISSHDKIAEKFLEETRQSDRNEFNALHLIFVLMPQLIMIEKTKELEAGWILATLSKDDAVKVINDWSDHLGKHKKPENIDVLIEANPSHKKFQVAFLSELPSISKKLVKTETGLVGLASWPEVNPRNVRDKIYYILKKMGKPLHFEEIAKKIAEQNFDKKNIVRATVHNELIADKRFVLVGRGIYGLSEWGYKEGTVCDIIKNILEDAKSGLTSERIVEEVGRQRLVKKNTVLINLQTKPLFKKLANGKYALK